MHVVVNPPNKPTDKNATLVIRDAAVDEYQYGWRTVDLLKDTEWPTLKALAGEFKFLAYSISYSMVLEEDSCILGRPKGTQLETMFYPFLRPFFHRAEEALDRLLYQKMYAKPKENIKSTVPTNTQSMNQSLGETLSSTNSYSNTPLKGQVVNPLKSGLFTPSPDGGHSLLTQNQKPKGNYDTTSYQNFKNKFSRPNQKEDSVDPIKPSKGSNVNMSQNDLERRTNALSMNDSFDQGPPNRLKDLSGSNPTPNANPNTYQPPLNGTVSNQFSQQQQQQPPTLKKDRDDGTKYFPDTGKQLKHHE